MSHVWQKQVLSWHGSNDIYLQPEMKHYNVYAYGGLNGLFSIVMYKEYNSRSNLQVKVGKEIHVQATPAMSTSRISILPLMSKWVFIPNIFFSTFPYISTPSMSKTVNMKQLVSQGNFSCPRRIFYYICYCLCRSKNRHIVCFGYVHVLAEVQTSSKQQ